MKLVVKAKQHHAYSLEMNFKQKEPGENTRSYLYRLDVPTYMFRRRYDKEHIGCHADLMLQGEVVCLNNID